MLTVTLVVLSAVTVAVALGEHLLAMAGSDLATPSAILFIPAFLLFHYVRTYAFSRQRPALAAGLSGVILLATVAGLGADYALGNKPDAGRVLLLTGLAFGAFRWPCCWCCCAVWGRCGVGRSCGGRRM